MEKEQLYTTAITNLFIASSLERKYLQEEFITSVFNNIYSLFFSLFNIQIEIVYDEIKYPYNENNYYGAIEEASYVIEDLVTIATHDNELILLSYYLEQLEAYLIGENTTNE